MRSRRVAAWLVSVPLMVVGSQVAHVLAYRLVYPNAHVRLSALLASGHTYMGRSAYLPMLLGLVFAAEIVGAGWTLIGSLRRGAFSSRCRRGRLRCCRCWPSRCRSCWSAGCRDRRSRGGWCCSRPSASVLLLQLPFAVVAYLAGPAAAAGRRGCRAGAHWFCWPGPGGSPSGSARCRRAAQVARARGLRRLPSPAGTAAARPLTAAEDLLPLERRSGQGGRLPSISRSLTL